MPVIDSDYRPPMFLANGYVQSILPTLVRRLPTHHFQRERIVTGDEDFLDLDWSRTGSRQLLIISHGLEGHSKRPYVAGVARAANQQGWDALAWNFRGCSGEPNRQLRFYHSGATDDLHHVVMHALEQGYEKIHLVGFSMGGNLSLLYAGRHADELPPAVESVTAFSVPCDLSASAAQLAKPNNKIFMKRFLRDLRSKVEAKEKQFPGHLSAEGYEQIKTFKQFDDRYTAPIHGFEDADDYWQQSSCISYLENIRIPSLLVNAKNDPFLPGSCFPYEQAQNNPNLLLEVPESGGHVGFIKLNRHQEYWMERRVVRFISSLPGSTECK